MDLNVELLILGPVMSSFLGKKLSEQLKHRMIDSNCSTHIEKQIEVLRVVLSELFQEGITHFY
jgi:hypothetical protein